jgi:23S rRNA pseudouridine2605 synthase
LDKASEGILLFTNDTTWSDRMTSPDAHVPKVYHVQVKPVPTEVQMRAMESGVEVAGGGIWCVSEVRLLRTGGKTAWLEITLHEGKNRQIRQILESLGLETLRLIRIAIGPLALGDLPKGGWRHLAPSELAGLQDPKGSRGG